MSNNSDMIKLVKLLEGAAPKFAGEPAQKPGDQVLGTDVAKTGGKEHPFKDRLVGEDTALEDVLSKKYQDFKDVHNKDSVKKKDKKELDESDYEDEDQGLFVTIGNEEDGMFAGMVYMDGGKWRESNLQGMPPHGWGGKTYMSYLTPDDIKSYILNDYGRHNDVKFFNDEDSAIHYAEMIGGNNRDYDDDMDESVTEGRGVDFGIGDPVEITGDVEFKGATGDVAAFNNDHSFVIVDLYNHGKRSFHVSDVSANEYAGSDAEEARMYDAGEFRNDLDEDAGDSPVANAITRRILLQRTDLLAKHGPEKVTAAIDEVADFVGDVEEIGSSDVSGWIQHVEQMLGNMDEGVAEGAEQIDELSKDTLKSYIDQTKEKRKAYNDAIRDVSMLGKSDSRIDNWAKEHDRLSGKLRIANRKIKQANKQGVAEGSEERYKVIFGRFGSIMPQPRFNDLKAAQRVAAVQQGKVIDTTTGKVVYDSQSMDEGVAEGWSWGWDSGDDSSAAHLYKTSYPEKIKAIAKGGGIGVQRTNNDLAGARRILQLYWQEQGQQWSPELDDKVKAQVRADVDKLMNVAEDTGSNPLDTVTLDIPLFIRMMEYAREDAKSDMDLHSATERMVKLAASGNTLSMDSYDQIVGMQSEQQVNEFGADGSAIGAAAQAKQMAVATKPATPGQANAAPTTSPTTSSSPTTKPGAQDVDPAEQDALDKIKANAGLKTQYDQLLQKAKTSV